MSNTSITLHGEFEPHPDDEEVWENYQPMEIHPRNGKLVFRYYTPEEAAKKEKRIERMERLMGPEPPKRGIIKDDAYYALYESDLDEDERPPLEVDPNLVDRDPGPIVLTPEERDLYIGFDDYHEEARSQLLASPSKKDEDMYAKEELKPTMDWNLHLAQDPTPQNDELQHTLAQTQGRAHRIEFEHEFKFKPGDVIMFLELRTEGKLPDPYKIKRYIEVHKDMNYFEDFGQYRVNFMDEYGPLYDGDMVVRFGNFNKSYHWKPHLNIDCFVYFIDVKPLEKDNPPLRPWYWIEDLQLKQPYKTWSTLAIPNPVAENTPIREVVPKFSLRDGDILMTHIWDTKIPRFDRIKSYIWNPLLASIGSDKGLRFALDLDPTKRMGPPKVWHPDFKIGGLVSFYTWEYLKHYGREPRPYVRLTDVGKYGVGNTTMALRFGTFKDPKTGPESPVWTWRERHTVELFVINTRGSSWRRVASSIWPLDMPRPLPSYDWKPHNPSDIAEVPRSFKPQAGDVIIRLSTDPEWVKMKADPHLVGDTYNAHYDVHIQMGICEEDATEFEQGDFLVRAAYEKNHSNPTWTNATVELYHKEGKDSWINTKSPWRFRGRDAFIFGTDSWQKGSLEGVQESGFGSMSVSDVEKLNEFDRTHFVDLDPAEVVWRQKGLREANKIGAEWQTD